MTDVLLGIPDAARALGIGRSKLYVLINEGSIEAVKIGRRALVPRSSIDSFVANLPRVATSQRKAG